jgi:hypothetical protein
MVADDIREAMRTQPFRPFSLRLADGRELFVRHPDFVSVSPNGYTVVVWSETAPTMSILDSDLIVSIETTAGGKKPGGKPRPKSS